LCCLTALQQREQGIIPRTFAITRGEPVLRSLLFAPANHPRRVVGEREIRALLDAAY